MCARVADRIFRFYNFVRSYLVRSEQLIRVAWLASFPGSTDQLFFARSEKGWLVEPGSYVRKKAGQ